MPCNRYVALAAAVAGAQRSKVMPNWTAGSSRIAIAADISRDKAKELKDEINAVSKCTKGIRIDLNEATSAIEEDPDQDR